MLITNILLGIIIWVLVTILGGVVDIQCKLGKDHQNRKEVN
jgi:hypothetical protein